MMTSRIALAALALGLSLGASVPASAGEVPSQLVQQVQFYDPPSRGDGFRGEYSRPRFEDEDDDDDMPRRRFRGGEERGYRYERRVSIGQTCETSRGSCESRPAPVGAGCRCVIPGFGVKRGNITD